MTDLLNTNQPTLAFMMIGWQEMLILACPLFIVGIITTVLFLTGVIGPRKKK